MNNQRRKRIASVVARLGELEAFMTELKELVEEIKDEEQECLDNFPENLQCSERYEASEQAVSNLESAYDWFESADIEELTGYLEEAMQ